MFLNQAHCPRVLTTDSDTQPMHKIYCVRDDPLLTGILAVSTAIKHASTGIITYHHGSTKKKNNGN